MDIMVTTNTARRYVEPSQRRGVGRRAAGSGKLRPRCKLPYELTLGSPKPDTSATTTLAQVLVDGISRRRKNEEMLAERREFMQRLVRERDVRTEEEHKSAVLFQAVFRGRLERRKTVTKDGPPRGGGRLAMVHGGNESASVSSAGTKLELEDDDPDGSKARRRRREEAERFNAELSRELLNLAKEAGLVPMRGVTLAPKPQKTKKHFAEERRRAKEIDAAARVLQDLARNKFAKKRAHELLKTMLFSAQQKAVSAIQRTYRGHLARDEMLLKKSNFAAQLLQTRYRKIMAVTKLHQTKVLLLQQKREGDAAVRMQNALRRKLAVIRIGAIFRELRAKQPKPEKPKKAEPKASPKKNAGRNSPDLQRHLKWRNEYR